MPSERIASVLEQLDGFIEREIAPLQDEHPQYWDHRREHARTDWDANGIPRREWSELLAEMRRRADAAGWLRFALPAKLGGQDQLRDGDDPRPPGGQGSGPAQRSAE
jgi:alkylation response protein AidB-like acyl-CoA dehydrogenase